VAARAAPAHESTTRSAASISSCSLRRRTPRTVDASIKREEADVPRNPELENTGAFNA
jgi:hypothetical protein